MTIVRVKPVNRRLDPLAEFDRALNTFFKNELTNNNGNGNTFHRVPAVNVKETGEAFIMEIAAPGIEKSDFDIHIDKDVLTVSASKEPTAVEGAKVKKREFDYHSFRRTFRIPNTIDTTVIEATYRNGILELSLPKKEEAKELPPRKIEIA